MLDHAQCMLHTRNGYNFPAILEGGEWGFFWGEENRRRAYVGFESICADYVFLHVCAKFGIFAKHSRMHLGFVYFTVTIWLRDGVKGWAQHSGRIYIHTVLNE